MCCKSFRLRLDHDAVVPKFGELYFTIVEKLYIFVCRSRSGQIRGFLKVGSGLFLTVGSGSYSLSGSAALRLTHYMRGGMNLILRKGNILRASVFMIEENIESVAVNGERDIE